MSIVALKRKTQAQQSLSGKNPEATLVVHGPGQTRTITTGGGFSLNGRHRNIGRVGANQLFSKGGSKMVAGTTQLRGWGGTLGTYVGQEQNQTWKQNRCCGSNNTPVHTSTLNTKGMLALKNKWKKTPIPASVFEAAGRAPPTDPSQLETIFNNWVAVLSADKGDEIRPAHPKHQPPRRGLRGPQGRRDPQRQGRLRLQRPPRRRLLRLPH